MSQLPDGNYQEMRDTWDDYNHRQEFEHELIDRKTTWLLTTQAILFAAYGVTFERNYTDERLDRFRLVIGWSGLLIAAIVLVGVLGLIRSKRLSWKAYKDFFDGPQAPDLPTPFDGLQLEWGVNSHNTKLTLLHDVLLPMVFIGAWCFVSF